MTDTRITLPTRGLDDTQTDSVQKVGTTRDAQNVRSIHGPTGRVRLSQRDGMGKHFPAAGLGPIRAFTSMTFNSKSVTFEALEGELDSFGDGRGKVEELWSKTTGANESVLNIETDNLGNLYMVTGGTVEKRNTDGALLWTFSVPLENPDFTLGPLAIGDDLGVYVGVDGGAPGPEGASVYRISQLPQALTNETEPVLAWQLQTDMWTREMKLHQGTLILLEQDDVAEQAHIVTVSNIATATPDETNSIPCPYPATCLAVKDDGSFFTGHPFKLNRDSNAQHPGVGIPLVGWTPQDLEGWKTRGWSEFYADNITGYATGDHINAWFDSTGNGRHWLPGVPQNQAEAAPTPRYNEKGSLGVPCLDYDGTEGLFSQPGGGKDSQRDSCKTAVPNHGDAAYCTIIVCRPASQKTVNETDGAGIDIDYVRYLWQQRHHTHYEGLSTGFDTNATGAYQSGMVLNTDSTASPSDDDLFCWGKSKSLDGTPAPGYARPYTSSSGKRTGSALVDGSDDWDGMPALKGAGDFGWPKAELFDDPSVVEEGEGISIFTFMHCGGLDEAIVVEGTVSISGFEFEADDPHAFKAWGAGDSSGANIQGTAYIDGVSDGVQAITSNSKVSLSGSPTPGAATLSMVLDRNFMTRSLFRSTGVPVDRWEALPVSFRGVQTDSGGETIADGNFELNMELQPTALGLPAKHPTIRGFVGEVYAMITVGRRQTNADMVTLGGSQYHVWPTVLTHPMNAENQHALSGELDTPYDPITLGTLSTEMEKLEGYAAHRFGIHGRLNDTGFKHPHHPNDGSAIPEMHDLPLASNVTQSGQAWPPRQRSDAAMILKQDAKGRQIWCLLSEGVFAAPANGDIVRKDINGVLPLTGLTMARCTSGIAIGIEDDVFVFGPGAGTDSDEFCVVRIVDAIDDDDSPLVESFGWWPLAGSGEDENKIGFQPDVTIRGKADEFGNLHLPIVPGTLYLGLPAFDAIRSFTRDGVPLCRLTTLDHGAISYQNAHALALPPVNPEYFI